MQFFLKTLFKTIFIASFVVQFFSQDAFSQATDSKQIRERLTQIFYWQIADELKLSTVAEKKMVQVIEDISKKREKALAEREAAIVDLKKFEKKTNAPEVKAVLSRYQKALIDLSGLDTEEYNKLIEILGVENLAKFYLVRDSVTTRIRDAVKNANQTQTKK